jgi:2-amino-4-hydroxy-6-hydroxymethyldihydropteridine diphosphokinase
VTASSAEPGTESAHPILAFLALGSNLGDRLGNLQQAVNLLAAREMVEVLRSSRVYETEPVGPPQPDYLNAVIEIETTLLPRALLEVCLGVERDMGRERKERWGPRVIDIDVLTYGQEEIREPGLEIPHPRMHERAFVLAPLLELTADPSLPDGSAVGSLRTGTGILQGVALFAPALHIPP